MLSGVQFPSTAGQSCKNDWNLGLRLLHIGKILPPPYGGIESHIDTLLRALQECMSCTLIAAEPRSSGSGFDDIPYRVLTARSYGQISSVLLTPGVLALARQEWNRGGCNLLHVHCPNPFGDLATLMAPSDLPVVMSWHSDIVRQQWAIKFYGHIQRASLRRADRIVLPTPLHFTASRQLHISFLEKKIVYVPFGIDFGDFDGPEVGSQVSERLKSFAAGRPIILTVGRHVYYKGYDYLLHAFAHMQQNAVLVMIGTGVQSSKLEKLAQELHLQDRVLFMGEVSRSALVSAMRACDVFTLPSIEPSEAFGIASAEAMACGKPTVVCRLGNGVDYLNRDGQTSLLVPPRNPLALADALDTLIKNDAMRTAMGSAARQWVRSEFSVQAMLDAMISVYKELT